MKIFLLMCPVFSSHIVVYLDCLALINVFLSQHGAEVRRGASERDGG